MESNNTATPRQRWALYCITKKDYRNEILSKEEAAKLIKELGNPDYKKKKINKELPKTLSEELLDYLKSNINDLYRACIGEIGSKSIIEEEHNGEKKHYAFVGSCCGITYLSFRKNNKKAEEINKAANKYHREDILNILINKLPKKEYKYLDSIGCPFEAIWVQMQALQIKYYSLVKKFAESKGIQIEVKTFID